MRLSGRVESSSRGSKPNVPVEEEAEVQAADHLVLDLLLRAEDVGVVLRDVPHAQEPVQRAARLVAVHQPHLRVADRQVAVGAARVLVELDVRRAVHGLQAHGPLLDLREVHVVAVLLPVARLLPQLDVVEDRRLDLAVAAREVLRAPQLREAVPDDHPVRLPERHARRQLGEHEQVQLAPQLAVVARAGLLEPLEVGLEVLGGVERGAVDAGEHLAARVAAPVRAGEREQLERLDPARGRRVRAAAQVGERAVGVERDGVDALVADEVLDQLDLVGLVLGAEALERLVDVDVLARELLLRLDVLAHLLLQRGQVVLGDRDAVGELEVVVEAVLDRRPDRDLRCPGRGRAPRRRARARCRGGSARATRASGR